MSRHRSHPEWRRSLHESERRRMNHEREEIHNGSVASRLDLDEVEVSCSWQDPSFCRNGIIRSRQYANHVSGKTFEGARMKLESKRTAPCIEYVAMIYNESF